MWGVRESSKRADRLKAYIAARTKDGRNAVLSSSHSEHLLKGSIWKAPLRSAIVKHQDESISDSYGKMKRHFSNTSFWTFAVLLMAIMIFLASNVSATSSDWNISSLDTYGNVGQYTSIALDSYGIVHISYYDATNQDLKYATNGGGSWVYTTIDSAGSVGQYTSIALDSNDKVHISYYDATNQDLKYATNAGGSWAFSTIDATAYVGRDTSLALDSNDKVHISYYDSNNGDLKYATNSGGTWAYSTLDTTNNVGGLSSLCLDSNDKVHVSYYDDTNDDVKYATNSGGTWAYSVAADEPGQIQSTFLSLDSNNKAHISYTVGNALEYTTNAGGSWVGSLLDFSGTYVDDSSIALDSNGKAHISYYYTRNADGARDLRYATNAGGSWVLITIDTNGEFVGTYTSLALDSNDKVHISYYDQTNLDLKYATNADETKNYQVVDDPGDVGSHASIALDSSDNVHMSYYDSTNNDLKYATNAGGSWVYNTIDSAGIVGSYTSIALDSNDKVHISYYDQTNGDLKYATNAGGSWIYSIVDSGYYVGQYTSIAVDSSGKAHISYYDSPNGDLKYANNVGGSWAITTIDSASNVGLYSSIAIDSGGKIHISYLDSSNSDLKYANNVSGSWAITTIDSASTVGGSTHLALDFSDKVHISYYGGGVTQDLKYANNVIGSWTLTTLDTAGAVGESNSIDLDSDGYVHISYYDATNQDLKYATNGGGSWVYTTIDSAGSVGQYTSIALDSNDKVHISYYDSVNGDLRYITNSGGTWYIEALDCWGYGQFNSIAIDSNGNVHISYLDNTNNDLKYATKTGGVWTYTTLDSTGSVGSFTSLALDSIGKVHISYLDGTNSDLRYATNAGGSWIYATIDSSGLVGYGTSLALDSNDKVHISYLDMLNRDLKYATNAGGSWSYETIDSSGDVGSKPSMAIDSNNKVHISYVDATNGNLKYATNSGGTWVCYTLDNSGTIAFETSLALDSNGKVHISYSDGTNGDLKYATNAGGSWVYTALDSAGIVGQYTSLALDSNNKVHISYCDDTNDDLKYATNSGGSWVYSTLDSEGIVGWYTSITLDNSNKIHISYLCQISGTCAQLRYFSDFTSIPPIVIITSPTSDPTYLTTTSTISIGGTASDNDDIVRVVWSNAATGGSGIASGTTSWNVPSAALNFGINVITITAYDAGMNTATDVISITYDIVPNVPTSLLATRGDTQVILTWAAPTSNGGSSIINYEIYRGLTSTTITHFAQIGNVLTFTDTGLTNGQPYYYKVSARNAAGEGPLTSYVSAIPNIVPNAPQDFKFISVADREIYLSWQPPIPNGGTAVTGYRIYWGTSSGSLTNTPINLGSTVLSYVLSSYNEGITSGQTYYFQICASNSMGFGTRTGEISTATQSPYDNWDITTLERTSDTCSSIAIDSHDRVHIVYASINTCSLNYTTNATGPWITRVIDSLPGYQQFGWSCSMAIDSNDVIHVAYYDNCNYKVKYAHGSGASWVIETIDDHSGGDGAISLALDSADKVHIAYCSAYLAGFRYANNIDGSWSSSMTTFDTTVTSGGWQSIAVDSLGGVHIAYHKYDDNKLYYVSKTGTSFSTPIILDGGAYYPGYVGVSLAVDSLNNIHVCYATGNILGGPYTLKNVTKMSGGSWGPLNTVDSFYDGNYPVIRIDASDKVHILYSGGNGGYNDGGLRYATSTAGSAWNIIRIAGGYSYRSFDINSTGRLHIIAADHGNWDLSYIHDPGQITSSLFGGNGNDKILAMCTDPSGNVWVTGSTTSTNLPVTAGAFDTQGDTTDGVITDGFIAKFDPTFSALLFCTYFGMSLISEGGHNDIGYAIVCDSSGNVYVGGWTQSLSPIFPTTTGAYDTIGDEIYGDAFIMKLSPTGTVQYCTFLGGNGEDAILGLAVDGTYVYATGHTQYNEFPRTLGNNFANNGYKDIFVVKLNPAGGGSSDLVWSRIISGSDNEQGNAIALDGSGNVYICGVNSYGLYPILAGSYDTSFGTMGSTDGIFAKMTNAGALTNSSYLGGTGEDEALDLVVDSSGNILITGYSSSTVNFPKKGGYLSAITSGTELFVVKIDPTKGPNGLIFSTFLSNAGDSKGYSIDLDPSGNIYVAGMVQISDSIPVTTGAFQKTISGRAAYDAMLVKFNPSGSNVLYCTYMGSLITWPNDERITSIVVRGENDVVFAGYTSANGPPDPWPTSQGAYDRSFNGASWDGCVGRLILVQSTHAVVIDVPLEGGLYAGTITASWHMSLDPPTVTFQYARMTDGLQWGSWVSTGTTSTVSATGYSTGSQRGFRVRAIDTMGAQVALAEVFFTVDATGPVTTITFPTTGAWSDATVDFVWSATDVNGIMAYQYQIDSGTVKNDIAPLGTETTTALLAGSHTIRVRAQDSLGNWGSYTSLVTFNVDLTAPSAASITDPSVGEWNDGSVEISWNPATDAESGIKQYIIYIYKGGPLVHTSAPQTGTSYSYTVSDAGEDYTVEVTSVNNALLTADSSEVVFKVDLTAPAVTIDAPTEGQWLGSTIVAASWHVDTGAPVTEYQYSINEGVDWVSTGTMPSASIDFGSEGAGKKLLVRATNVAGSGTSDLRTFSIGSITVSSPTTSDIKRPGAGLTITWSWAHPSDFVNIDLYQGGTFVQDIDYVLNSGSYAWTVPLALPDGSYEARVQSGTYPSIYGDSGSFLVHSSMPALTITSPSTDPYYTKVGTLSMAGTVSDPVGINSVTWTNSMGGSGTAIYNGGDGTWTASGITLNPAGLNLISIQAYDTAGNVAWVDIDVYYDTFIPMAFITSPTSGETYYTNIATIALGGYITENYGIVSVEWTSDRGGSGSGAYNSGDGTWTISSVSLSVGANLITVETEDLAGNIGSDVITVTYENIAPTVAITSPTSGPTYSINLAFINLAGEAFDASGILQVTWSNDRGGSGIASITENWSASGVALYVGENIITVTAYDLAGNTASDIITIIYDNVVPTATITSPTTDPTYSTSSYYIILGGSVSDDRVVAEVRWYNSLTGEIGKASLGAFGWSCSISLDVGANALIITAFDAAGNTAEDNIVVTRVSSSEEVLEAATVALPSTLDPAIAYDSIGWGVSQNIYETLVWYTGSDTDVLVPVLATTVPSVENGGITDGGLTYVLHLREGVLFHDGTTMDAYDVEFSLERVLVINDPSGPAWTLGRCTIPGYNNSILDSGLIDAAFEVINAHTIEIHLIHPYAPFLQILATPVANIVSMEYVIANEPDVAGQINTWMTDHACGSGPFRLGDINAGVALELQRFDSYRSGPSILPGILISQMTYEQAKTQIEVGAIDILLDTPPIASRAQFETLSNVIIEEGEPEYGVNFIGFNQQIQAGLDLGTITSDFFSDVNVRKALVHAFDYTTYINVALEGYGQRTNGLVPEAVFGYDPNIPYATYNLGLAAAYLENAGTWADTGFTIKLYYNTGNYWRQTQLEMLKSGLEKLYLDGYVLGAIQVDVIALDWPTYVDAWNNQKLPTYAIGWAFDYSDADDIVSEFLHDDGTWAQRIGFSDSAMSAKVDLAAQTMDTAQRLILYSEIAQGAYDNAYYLFSHQTQSYFVHSKRVLGYQFNPMYGCDSLFYQMSFDTTAPTIKITSPTSGSTHVTYQNSIYLAGISSDHGGSGVVSIEYSNSAGGSGIATGTTFWNVDGLSLSIGVNIITVTAIDFGGNIATDTLAVTLKAAAPTWTFMVYMDGDNDLELSAINDFIEMSDVGSNADINILVLFDRAPELSDDFGNWEGTLLFHVLPGDVPDVDHALAIDLGEMDMGNPSTLYEFLDMGLALYPADNYVLVLWDHGSATRGICKDKTNSTTGQSSYLSLDEICSVLSEHEAATGMHIGLLGMDACYMGTTEVVYELRHNADVIVACQEVSPADGWDYSPVLTHLKANPWMTMLELGDDIVGHYMQSYAFNSKYETICSVNCSAVDSFVPIFVAFASQLVDDVSIYYNLISDSRETSEEMQWDYMVDMINFLEQLENRLPPSELRSKVIELHASYLTVIQAAGNGDLNPGANGLSIYFPKNWTSLDASYETMHIASPYVTNVTFMEETPWLNFLKQFLGDIPTPPGVPRQPIASPLNGAIKLTWNKADSHGAMIDRYEINYYTDGVPETYLGQTPDTTFEHDDLINGQSYYYKVVAHNSQGYGPSTDYLLGIPTSAPTAPKNLRVTAIGDSNVTLAWDTPDSMPPGSWYVLSYVPASGVREMIDNVVSPYTIEGLKNGKPYTIFIQTRDAGSYGPESNLVEGCLPGITSLIAPTALNTGETYEVTWERPAYLINDFISPPTTFGDVNISLFFGGFMVILEEYYPSEGSFHWTVPLELPQGTSYLLVVESCRYPWVYAASPFMTVNSSAHPEITVTTPTSLDRWTSGQSLHVGWTSIDLDGQVSVYLVSLNYTIMPIKLGEDAVSSGSFNWVIDPQLNLESRSDYQVLVCSSDYLWVQNCSETFSIWDGVLVTNPRYDTNWFVGETVLINWSTAYPIDDLVRIELITYDGRAFILCDGELNDGQWSWAIPRTFLTDNGLEQLGQYRIRVTDLTIGKRDISDDGLLLTSRLLITLPYRTSTTPIFNMTMGWNYAITWLTAYNEDPTGKSVSIELWDDAGLVRSIATVVSTEFYYDLFVPTDLNEDTEYFLVIHDTLDPNIWDQSHRFKLDYQIVPLSEIFHRVGPINSWESGTQDSYQNLYYVDGKTVIGRNTSVVGKYNNLDPGKYNYLDPGKFNTLDPGRYNFIDPGRYNYLDPGKYNYLDPGKYNTLDPGKFNTMDPGRYSFLDPGRYIWFDPGRYNSLDPGRYNNLDPGKYNFLDPGKYNYLDPGKYNFLDPGKYNTLDPGRYNTMDPGKYNFLDPGRYSFFDPGKYNFLDPGKYNTLDPGRYNAMDPGKYNFLDPGKYNFLDPGKYNFLDPGKYNTLDPGKYNSFDPGKYNYLDPGKYNTLDPGKSMDLDSVDAKVYGRSDMYWSPTYEAVYDQLYTNTTYIIFNNGPGLSKGDLKLDLEASDGKLYPIVSKVPADADYMFNMPFLPEGDAKLRITNTLHPEISFEYDVHVNNGQNAETPNQALATPGSGSAMISIGLSTGDTALYNVYRVEPEIIPEEVQEGSIVMAKSTLYSNYFTDGAEQNEQLMGSEDLGQVLTGYQITKLSQQLSASQQAIVDTGLVDGITYFYLIYKVIDGVESDQFTIVEATPTKEYAPYPLASLKASRITGNTATLFSFDASDSYDPKFDKSLLLAFWEFGDGTYRDWSFSMMVGHYFTWSGIYHVTAWVMNPDGYLVPVSCLVMVDDTPTTTLIMGSNPDGSNDWYQTSPTFKLKAFDVQGYETTTWYAMDDGAGASIPLTMYVANSDISFPHEGIWTVQYNSTNYLGYAEFPQAYVVRIDHSEPTTSHTLIGTLGQGGYYSTDVMVSLAAIDSGSSGNQKTFYSTNGADFMDYTISLTFSSSSTIHYYSIDFAGNVEEAKTVSFNIDKVDPYVTITNPTEGSNDYDGSVTVEWTGDGTGSQVSYEIDYGSGFAPASSPWTRSFPSGAYSIAVRATDNAGLTASSIVHINVDIDLTPPVTSHTLAGTLGAGGYYSTDVQVELTATDSGAGVDKTYYSTNGIDYSEYSTAFTFSVSTTLYYYSIDNLGNEEIALIVSIAIDKLAPTVMISSPSDYSYDSDGLITIVWSGDGTGSVINYMIDYGTGFASATSPWTQALADGLQAISIKAIDGADNEAIAIIHVTVDTSPPTMPVITSPITGSWLGSTLYVEWTASMDTGSGISHYIVTFYRDGSPVHTSTPLVSTSFDWNMGTTGDYDIMVSAVNNAGLVADSSTVLIHVDITPPTAPVINFPRSGEWTKPSITVSWSPSTDTGSGLDYYIVKFFKEGSPAHTSGPITMTNYLWTAPSDGSYSVKVTAYDKVGLIRDSTEIAFGVDSTNPTLEITSPTDQPTWLTNLGVISLAGTCSDVAGIYKLIWTNDRGGGGNPTGTTSWTITSITLYAGVNVITVTASDNANNLATDVITITYDNVPPTLTFNSPNNNTWLNVDSVLVSFASDGTSFEQSTDGGTYTACSSTSATFSSLSDGTRNLMIRATDLAGNKRTFYLSVNIDTVQPTITIISPALDPYYTAQSIIDLTGTASDNNQIQSVTWHIDGHSGTAIGTTAWSIQLPLRPGINNIVVVAHDLSGNTNSDTITVYYDYRKPTVIITSPTSDATYLTTLTAIDLSGSASDDFGVVSVIWSSDRGHNGVASGIATWTVSTVPLEPGTNVITITASDAAGNFETDVITVQIEYTLTIVSAHAPVTKSPDQELYTYGTPVTLTLGTVESGWTFTGWSGNVIAGVVTMNADTTVTASFTQDQYELTIVSAHAPVTKSPDQELYTYGTPVTLTLGTVESGWTFTGWSGNVIAGVVTMNADTTVTASFTQDQYELTIVSAHAPVTKSPDQELYTYGTPVTLTLGTVESGWTFTGWSGNVIAGVVTMNADTTVTASFTQDQYAADHRQCPRPGDQVSGSGALHLRHPGHPHPRHGRVRLDLHRLEWQRDRRRGDHER